MFRPDTIKKIAAANVENEIIESIRASVPEACKDDEFTAFPVLLKYIPSNIFTTTAEPVTISVSAEWSGVIGEMIFLTDSANDAKPAYRTRNAISTVLIYSILP